MNVQSISIVVPTKRCVNSCKFCVSCMHTNEYEDKFNEFQIKKRIKYAVNNGVNNCILTGTGEALQNREFLKKLANIFDELRHPFPNVELQTSGVFLSEAIGSSPNIDNIRLLQRLGVNTISLSVSSIFDTRKNQEIIGVNDTLYFDLMNLCHLIVAMGFNLRLSINMTNELDGYSPKAILDQCKRLKAQQITFRKLYYSDDKSEQSEWVKLNACREKTLNRLSEYIAGGYLSDGEFIKGQGSPLYRLPFGAMAYSIMGMSTVIDDNCMSEEDTEKLKYVILRENAKLYSKWDDEGSLIF